MKNKRALAEIVERSLKRAALWDEVSHRLKDSALALSGGQQQRLCIARALATDPEVLLMDEPASALDPASTARIEDLIFELKQNYTIVIVTHNMQQAVAGQRMDRILLSGKTGGNGINGPDFHQAPRKRYGRLHYWPFRLSLSGLASVLSLLCCECTEPGVFCSPQEFDPKEFDMSIHLMRDLEALHRSVLSMPRRVSKNW